MATRTEPEPRRGSLESWRDNADRWTRAVRGTRIASRVAATDEAIVQAVLARSPRDVLDLGCGEGWLAREVSRHGVTVVGIDGSPALVEHARTSGGGAFHVCAYCDLAACPERFGRFDVVVANFSWFEEDLAPLVACVPRMLRAEGALLVQTLHPCLVPDPDRPGWRLETFAGFRDEEPWTPMPWYFRTLDEWRQLLTPHGTNFTMKEVRHPTTEANLSVLMSLEQRPEPWPGSAGKRLSAG